MLKEHDPSTISTLEVPLGLEHSNQLLSPTTTKDDVTSNVVAEINEQMMIWRMRERIYRSGLAMCILWMIICVIILCVTNPMCKFPCERKGS